MGHTKPPPTEPLKAIVELDDQWLLFAERSAFIGEAYARLLANHPNLPAEVIQGGASEIRQLRQQSQEIGNQLIKVRQLVQHSIEAALQPKQQD